MHYLVFLSNICHVSNANMEVMILQFLAHMSAQAITLKHIFKNRTQSLLFIATLPGTLHYQIIEKSKENNHFSIFCYSSLF